MKKIIALLSIVIFSVTCFSQKKDSTVKDSVIVAQIIFTKDEFDAFVKSIKDLDEKPSILNAILTPFYQRTQYFKVPSPKK